MLSTTCGFNSATVRWRVRQLPSGVGNVLGMSQIRGETKRLLSPRRAVSEPVARYVKFLAHSPSLPLLAVDIQSCMLDMSERSDKLSKVAEAAKESSNNCGITINAHAHCD
ncbi:hypothetical protein EG68_02277 [Paragonimus skrjabini miyazakii]|uniref:Uncharacterized protein n=1 Tax=Paragonimus skrjabini miyazakii TaxID=59628 RepID=A0A8S9YYP6_9TREM|nr:hypothetical protein EG68_02277 [Paragonimus skrjabini miyazakii]